jgi:predicted hotdog family 3-hydroxylacyl-ACP dehydratase
VVPAWIGLEYIAQCIAAHGGLRARSRGEEIRIGFLLGSRRLEIRTSGFRPGQALAVRVEHVWGDRQLYSFACLIADLASGARLMEGLVNVFRPEAPSSLESEAAVRQ